MLRDAACGVVHYHYHDHRPRPTETTRARQMHHARPVHLREFPPQELHHGSSQTSKSLPTQAPSGTVVTSLAGTRWRVRLPELPQKRLLAVGQAVGRQLLPGTHWWGVQWGQTEAVDRADCHPNEVLRGEWWRGGGGVTPPDLLAQACPLVPDPWCANGTSRRLSRNARCSCARHGRKGGEWGGGGGHAKGQGEGG